VGERQTVSWLGILLPSSWTCGRSRGLLGVSELKLKLERRGNVARRGEEEGPMENIKGERAGKVSRLTSASKDRRGLYS
jgi:hypothetical protein